MLITVTILSWLIFNFIFKFRKKDWTFFLNFFFKFWNFSNWFSLSNFFFHIFLFCSTATFSSSSFNFDVGMFSSFEKGFVRIEGYTIMTLKHLFKSFMSRGARMEERGFCSVLSTFFGATVGVRNTATVTQKKALTLFTYTKVWVMYCTLQSKMINRDCIWSRLI